MKTLAALFLALSFLAAGSAGAVRLTQRCGATPSHEVGLYASTAAADRIAAVVKDPRADPALYEALWEPTGYGGGWLQYAPGQDPDEIAASLKSDPALAALGVSSAFTYAEYARAAAAAGIFLYPHIVGTKRATEYHDTIRDHYYLASGYGETGFIDAGGAGPGWVRTGQAFTVWDLPNSLDHPVYEFYAPAFDSHFFTQDPAECGYLRRTSGDWKMLGIAFWIPDFVGSEGEACTAATTPLFRLFNDFIGGTPAHRFTIDARIRDDMVARGWVYEGVAMCVGRPG